MFRPPAAVLAEPAPRALLQIATLSALFRSAFPAPPASPLYLPAPASHTATHCHEPASPSFVKRHSSPPANKPPRQAQERPYRRDHRCAAWHRLTQPPSALVCTRRGALQRGGRAAARGKSRARRRRQGAVHRCSRGRAPRGPRARYVSRDIYWPISARLAVHRWSTALSASPCGRHSSRAAAQGP